MRQNSLSQHYKISAKSKAVKSNAFKIWMQLSLLGLGALVLTFHVHAEEPLQVKPNLYADKYVKQNDSHLRSLSTNPDTQLEIGKIPSEDNSSMLEKGYDMMGSSTFVSPLLPAELAVSHGKKIKADTVLVYSSKVPVKTKIVRFDNNQEALKAAEEANNEVEKSAQTIHYASYWAKLPMPSLGVHAIKLIPAENQGIAQAEKVKGLTVIAVIKESPAAKAGLYKGDNLVKIGELALDKPDDLFAAVGRYAGQTVPVEVERGNQLVKTNVTLNPRK